MYINVQRPDFQSIQFWFHANELDAEPPLPMVFVNAENLGRVKEERLALCGYCLTRNLIGNAIAFDGVNVGAHVAAALQADFEGHELFVGPITNHPKKIGVKDEGKVGVFEYAGGDIADSTHLVRMTEWELGFRCASESEVIGEIRTNIGLWAGLSCTRPDLLTRTLCILLISDVYGISEFRCLGDVTADKWFSDNIRDLCREVGINVV